jgi:hypothetical protein
MNPNKNENKLKNSETSNDKLKNVSFKNDLSENNLGMGSGTSIGKSKNTRFEIDASMEKNEKNERNEKNALDEEKKNKIFMTENFLHLESKELFTFHDVIVPGGKNSKLVNKKYNLVSY